MHSKDMTSPRAQEQHEAYRLIEAALLDYVVRYGLTEKAKVALQIGRKATTGETTRGNN